MNGELWVIVRGGGHVGETLSYHQNLNVALCKENCTTVLSRAHDITFLLPATTVDELHRCDG